MNLVSVSLSTSETYITMNFDIHWSSKSECGGAIKLSLWRLDWALLVQFNISVISSPESYVPVWLAPCKTNKFDHTLRFRIGQAERGVTCTILVLVLLGKNENVVLVKVGKMEILKLVEMVIMKLARQQKYSKTNRSYEYDVVISYHIVIFKNIRSVARLSMLYVRNLGTQSTTKTSREIDPKMNWNYQCIVCMNMW